MKFYTEKVSEEDKAKIDWSKCNNERHWPLPNIWRWTINEERDSFFTTIRLRMPEIPYIVCLFNWKGYVIHVKSILSYKNTNMLKDNGYPVGDEYWSILSIFFPKELMDQKSTVLADLEAAIKCGGELSCRDDPRGKSFVAYHPEFKLILIDQPPENRTGLKLPKFSI